ncbi:hypothetical protein [Saccharopolyspora griseoalba]|uniref:Uncharacterized protein n=1 Tax=Saccharopolyspora griseoalba TaxID=1431848 RepID=A0ABW2LQ52_9PSEU
MAEPVQNQMTADVLAAVVQQLQEAGSGDTPISVNLGDQVVLPVLGSAVRFRDGQSHLELRVPEVPAAE